jgi:hypothetical protein
MIRRYNRVIYALNTTVNMVFPCYCCACNIVSHSGRCVYLLSVYILVVVTNPAQEGSVTTSIKMEVPTLRYVT